MKYKPSQTLVTSKHQTSYASFNTLQGHPLYFEGRTRTLSKLQPIMPIFQEDHQLKKKNAKSLSVSIARFLSQIKDSYCKQGHLQSAIAVLDGFSVVQNNYQEVFKHLCECLRVFLFHPKFKTNLESRPVYLGKTYKTAFEEGQLHFQNKVEKERAKLVKAHEQLNEMKQYIKQKEQKHKGESQRLLAEAERYKQIANVQYTLELESKIVSLEQELEGSKNSNQALLKRHKEIMQCIQDYNCRVEKDAAIIKNLEENLSRMKEDRQKSEDYFMSVKSKLDEIMVRIGGLKDVIAKVEAENQNLVSQRLKLVNRAAVSFDQLTPRPSLNGYFQSENENELLAKNRQMLKPTMEIVKFLLEKLRESGVNLEAKMFIRQPNRRLLESEKAREGMLYEVLRFKSEGKKLFFK